MDNIISEETAKFVEPLKFLDNPIVAKLDYKDPFLAFSQQAKGAEGELFLDGNNDINEKGRYSIIALNPAFTISVTGDMASIRSGGKQNSFNATPLGIIKWAQNIIPATSSKLECFNGGIICLLPYELNSYFENRPALLKKNKDVPDIWLALYPTVEVYDNKLKEAYSISHTDNEKEGETVGAVDKHYLLSDFHSRETKDSYCKKIDKVKSYIESGDIYQANISRKLTASFKGNPVTLYGDLRSINPSAYGAYIRGDGFDFISMSPEKFFTVSNNEIETMPIKGTAKRSDNKMKDQQLKKELELSEKERAENVMIVDLMRNDISKVCEPGSVKVSKLCHVETLPTLHHLVSTVKGCLRDGAKLLDILKATFPGGSITGAPKIRAMEIIAELEEEPRGFYCGSLTSLGFNGNITSSILIRSITIKDGTAEYRTGGGITADSDKQSEFEETELKASVLSLITGVKHARTA